VKFVGARFGKDLYAAIAQLVVFGGKRSLIDANLANGFLGRKLAGSKTVDIELAAVRSRGFTCSVKGNRGTIRKFPNPGIIAANPTAKM